MIFNNKHTGSFYIEYHRLGDTSFRDRVRFYEDHKNRLNELDYSERIEVDLNYSMCLFEIGKYHKYLEIVDRLIEVVIIDNIYEFNDENIYNSLLFKKSACLYNTGQYQKSEKVLKALSRLDRDNQLARQLFSKCKRKQNRVWYEGIKAIAMVMFISAMSIAFMETLIVRPFYNEYVNTFSNLKWAFIAIALISLLTNEMILKYTVAKEIGYQFGLKNFKEKINFRK